MQRSTTPDTHSPQPLAALVEHAGAQVVILREALREAVQVERLAAGRIRDIDARVQQSERFAVELDDRIREVGVAAGVLERAIGALRRLDDLLNRINTAGGAIEARAERRIADAESRLSARLDQLDADLDRRAAGIQARAALTLDAAEERVRTLEAAAERAGGDAAKHVDSLCARAARLLGHDPRWPRPRHDDPIADSLADLTVRAEHAARDAQDAVARLRTAGSLGDAAASRLETAAAGVLGAISDSEQERARIGLAADALAVRAAAQQTDARLALALAAEQAAALMAVARDAAELANHPYPSAPSPAAVPGHLSRKAA